jgi:hypothetical protein
VSCLNDLPTDHPLRVSPLVGCWYRYKDKTFWREILPTYKIAGKCFNDLDDAWTRDSVFSFTKDTHVED